MFPGNYKPIIALCGHQASGKSTVAKHLESVYGFKRIALAGPLKSMLHAAGLTLEDTDGRNKENPHPLLCGKTPRYAMQTLGTEWGRNLIGQVLWTNIWADQTMKALANEEYAGVVCDDLRFLNEADFVKSQNAIIVRVMRDHHRDTEPAKHPSEAEYRDIVYDMNLDNRGSWNTTTTQIAKWFGKV